MIGTFLVLRSNVKIPVSLTGKQVNITAFVLCAISEVCAIAIEDEPEAPNSLYGDDDSEQECASAEGTESFQGRGSTL